jgi:hypothetical protein
MPFSVAFLKNVFLGKHTQPLISRETVHNDFYERSFFGLAVLRLGLKKCMKFSFFI